jgi:Putative transposase of IS4/5 family (DUF4096)
MLPNLPNGMPRVDDRHALNGIFWVLRSGARWRDLPGVPRSAYDLQQALPRRWTPTIGSIFPAASMTLGETAGEISGDGDARLRPSWL